MAIVLGGFIFSAVMGMVVEYTPLLNKGRNTYYQLPEEGKKQTEEEQEKQKD